MKKANLLLDNQSTGLTIIEKMDFEKVNELFDTLHWVFHPNGEDDLDIRFVSLWQLFLISTGWTEDEFWSEWDSRPRHCKDCGKSLNSEGDIIEPNKEPEPGSNLN